jgi:hypothetical protein
MKRSAFFALAVGIALGALARWATTHGQATQPR